MPNIFLLISNQDNHIIKQFFSQNQSNLFLYQSFMLLFYLKHIIYSFFITPYLLNQYQKSIFPFSLPFHIFFPNNNQQAITGGGQISMLEQYISILQKNNIICVMSVTISTCQQICKNPTNNSPSKMLYSFPKSTRFQSRKMIYCDRYYEMPSTVASCRTTTFGMGQKYDFTQDAPKNPPPNTYDISSTFTPRPSQGFGFGKGREEMEATGPLCSVRTNKNPGPGTYQAANPASKTAYSIGSKWHEQDGQKEIPGPGAYPLTFTISQSGSYFLSKHKSSCVRNFSKMGGRIEASSSKIPGPGSYNTSRADLSPNGRYPSSKMQNCLTRKFPISNRRPIAENNENPGPGNYRLPSQFGQYTSKRAFMQQTHNKISSKINKTAKTEQTHS